MINRYESVITVIDGTKNKMLALKFKIIDGHLYAYNMYAAVENRKMLEVLKINNIEISKIIDRIKEEDLYNVEVLKKYGIDTEKKFILSMIDENSVIEFNVFDLESQDKVFYKEHDINENIANEEIQIENIGNSSQNLMLDYASTNFKALLKILKANCLSQTDKNSISEVLTAMESTNDNYGNASNNLDMLFLSSQLLLMMEDKIDYLPDNIIYTISKSGQIQFKFDGENLEDNNSAILTNGEIDYVKVVNMMRNAIAHSNYKVLDNGLIEFYDEGKKGKMKMHFTIAKNDIKLLFSQLYNYKYLEGTFPYLYANKLIVTPNPLNYDELVDYLNQLVLYDITSYEHTRYREEDLGMNLYYFNNLTYAEEIETLFNWYIKKHLSNNCQLSKQKLNNQDIKYVLESIKEMGEEYFFKLGSTSQIEVVEKLIKFKYNKKYELISNIDAIVEASYNSNESLTARSFDYINLKSNLELTITVMLNTLFMFCYNQNNSTIDAGDIRFPETVYKQYMDSRIKEFYDVSKEAADYQNIYISLLKATPSHLIKVEDLESVEKKITKTKNVLVKCKNEINLSGVILEESATRENYDQINKEILHRFRDCLAHGRLKIENIDINNVGNTKLSFYDTYMGQDKFKATISLEELLKTINQVEFLKTMFNNNANFTKHSL